jgi:hypothetical protein
VVAAALQLPPPARTILGSVTGRAPPLPPPNSNLNTAQSKSFSLWISRKEEDYKWVRAVIT